MAKHGKLSRGKAKKILHEGLSSAGDGFHSERQRKFIAARASGQPVRRKKKVRGAGHQGSPFEFVKSKSYSARGKMGRLNN